MAKPKNNPLTFHITNQQSVDYTDLMPIIDDPMIDLQTGAQKALTELINRFFTPLQAGSNVDVTLNNQSYDKDQFTNDLINVLTNTNENPQLNDQFSVLFHQSSQYKDSRIQNYKNIIANSILLKQKLPLPSNNIKYTYDADIQRQSKEYLTNPTPDNLQELNNGLIGTLVERPINNSWNFILIKNEKEYNKIKDTIDQLINQANIDPETQKKAIDIQSIQLDQHSSFNSWVTGQDNDANQINRFITKALIQNQADWLPINLHAMIQPLGFSFINLENLINSDQRSYSQELNQIANVTNKLVHFKMTTFKKVATAKSINQSMQKPKIRQKQYQKVANQIAQRKQVGFQKTMPSFKQQLNRLVQIVNSQTSKIMSDNSYKQTRTTFMRPNRRYPDDPSLRGSVQTTHYHPDLHIYLDTSGSIEEQQYRSAVTMLIMITQKLKTNLYFTSFSHEILPPVKLITKNVSPATVYSEIKRIPKASGGTEYENVWNMIDTISRQNQAHGQAPRLNFVITDFEYDLRNSWTPRVNQASTIKTYYLPMAANQYDYDYCRKFGLEFANELIDHGDLNIKSRILM